MTLNDVPIRDAATVIVQRRRENGPEVLMGQRGAKAVFMPNKFVFPGGAVDPEDHDIPLFAPLAEPCLTNLQEGVPATLASGLIAGAIRELFEETGLILGSKAEWDSPPPSWSAFANAGYCPTGEGLEFVFRAITPKGRSRRFDARFFLVDADRIANDLDDFSSAEDELSHLQWIPLTKVRSFDLPFITEVVLAEIGSRVPNVASTSGVPFFKNDDERHHVARLGGIRLLDY